MSESRKVFVRYKYKDWDVFPLYEYTPGEDTDFLYTPRHYVDKIIESIQDTHIYKGEKGDEDVSHLADDTIDSRLKEKLFDSSVTIVLLSPNMKNVSSPAKDQWIPAEIAYSLRAGKRRGDRSSGINGMLAVALPDRSGSYNYAVIERECGVTSWQTHSYFEIIGENMFNRKNKNQEFCQSCGGSHHYGWDHSYIHPIKWEDFIANPDVYIDRAISLRDAEAEFTLRKTV